MDETVQRSCWSITLKAAIGFAAILLVIWLVGGADAATVLAG